MTTANLPSPLLNFLELKYLFNQQSLCHPHFLPFNQSSICFPHTSVLNEDNFAIGWELIQSFCLAELVSLSEFGTRSWRVFTAVRWEELASQSLISAAV